MSVEVDYIFKQASVADKARIIEFQEKYHNGGKYAEEIFEGYAPEMVYTNYLYLEHDITKEIIACTMLIPEYVYIQGVQFKCGRFELTATYEKYRNKGMMRRLFKESEIWYLSKGGDLTTVSGKPWFYSQFDGYSLARGSHNLMVAFNNLDYYSNKTKYLKCYSSDKKEFELICEKYKEYIQIQRFGNIHYRDKELMQYDLYPNGSITIKDDNNDFIGGFLYLPEFEDGYIEIIRVIFIESICLIDIRNIIFKYCLQIKKEFPNKVYKGIKFTLGNDHPFYGVIKTNNIFDNTLTKSIISSINNDFTGYYKVLNQKDFIMQLIPVFEKRIANSPIRNYTGEFKIGTYKNFFCLHFKFCKGLIVSLDIIEQEYGNANIPIEMLIQLISGYLKFDELYPRYYTEIFIQDEDDRYILKSLFD